MDEGLENRTTPSASSDQHSPDEDGWDVGAIVQYWSTQADNFGLSTVELGFKAISLFGVSVYPRVSDMARLA